jgi:hypothetical protein
VAQVLSQTKGVYCKVRSVAYAGETCHIPFEPGWVTEPRGIRKGELIEPDMMMEITSFFIDNSVSVPVMDNLVLAIWFSTWLMYLVVTFGIMYTVSWCVCMRQTKV